MPRRVIRPTASPGYDGADTEPVPDGVVAPPPVTHDEVHVDKHAHAIGRKVKTKRNANKFIAPDATIATDKIGQTAAKLQLLDSEHKQDKRPLAPTSKAKARATMKRKLKAAAAADPTVDSAAYGVMTYPAPTAYGVMTCHEPNVKDYNAAAKRISANNSNGPDADDPDDHMHPNEDKEYADVFMGVNVQSSRAVSSGMIPAWPVADGYVWPEDDKNDETVWPENDETVWPEETTLPEATASEHADETTWPEATASEHAEYTESVAPRSRGTRTWVGGWGGHLSPHEIGAASPKARGGLSKARGGHGG